MYLNLNFEKKYDNRYKVRLLPNSITDLFGIVNDTLNFNATTKKPEDYGSLGIAVQNVESFPFIIDLLDKDNNIIERVISTERTNFSFEHLNPNDYMVIIIYDTNKNNQWDSGNFLMKIKPEKVVYFNALIELRANWDVNEVFNIQLK